MLNIPLKKPSLAGNEEKYVLEAIRSSWIAPSGPFVKRFEDALATKLSIDHVIATNTGTAAIEVGLKLLGVKAGDLVLCSTFTFIATATPIKHLGARIIFLDCDKDYWQLNLDLLEETLETQAKKNDLPKVLVVANIYGSSCQMDRVLEICKQYNVSILEDAAECIGGTYKDRYIGTWGDIGILSFNGNKMITTSAGGAILCKDPHLMQRARHLIAQAKINKHSFEHDEIAYNFSMSNILAAVGLAQLESLDQYVHRCRTIYQNYQNLLKHIDGIQFMQDLPDCHGTAWLTNILLPKEIHIPTLISKMASKGIELRRLWTPLHLQMPFSKEHYVDINISSELWARGIGLPSSPTLTEIEQNYVVQSLIATLPNISSCTESHCYQ